jgi:thiol-disulfide isomerase/thioredoxin
LRSVRLLPLLSSALALLAAGPAPAEPVKLLKPADYRSRVVAPKGGRVLVVNFWATWCLPCREEMPRLIAASKSFSTMQLAVVLVATDTPRTAREVPKFLADVKSPFICWQVKSRDPQNFIDAVDRSWDGTLPYTLVYDREGAVAVRLAGAQTEASFSEAIRKALGATR